MSRFIARAALFACFVSSIANTQLTHAQQATSLIDLPNYTVTSSYQGSAVWQQPNGGSLRGVFYLTLIDDGPTRNQPNSLKLEARLEFRSPNGDYLYAYYFSGKMDPNGRGFIRYVADEPDSYPHPLPTLNPGKVSVLRTGSRSVVNTENVISGGVLAADGTQLILRAELLESIVPL